MPEASNADPETGEAFQDLIAAARQAIEAMQNMRQGRFRFSVERLNAALIPFVLNGKAKL